MRTHEDADAGIEGTEEKVASEFRLSDAARQRVIQFTHAGVIQPIVRRSGIAPALMGHMRTPTQGGTIWQVLLGHHTRHILPVVGEKSGVQPCPECLVGRHRPRLDEDGTGNGVGSVSQRTRTFQNNEPVGYEWIDLGGMLGSPLLPLLSHTVVQDQHPLAVQPVNDRLENGRARLQHGDPADAFQDLPERL